MAKEYKKLNFSLININKLLLKNYSINKQFRNNDLMLGYYLAGLIEGDGYISINNKNKVILGITVNIKDLYLAEKVLNYLGQGFIVKRKTNSIELRFTTVKVLEKIINLVNGKFRTPALCCGITLLREQLSNSGNILKLMVPNYIWKNISGWINYSGMVTSHKMIENEIDYRGSKSKLNNMNFVKEQRVDGSWSRAKSNKMLLRFTLMDYENSYQIKILSKQLNKSRYYNTLAVKQTNTPLDNEIKMNPWFFTGFTDGEGCFLINITKSNNYVNDWGARATFKIGLAKKDLPILYRIHSFLGVGNITTRDFSCSYAIQSIKDLQVLIDHFDKYPLMTQKGADYLLFKRAFILIKNKEHLSLEGLRKIVAIKASINWGISLANKEAFPNTIPVTRPSILDFKFKDPNWLAGFTSAEGCFLVRIIKTSNRRIGYQVQLVFKLVQHSRDEQMMKSLIDYLGCGTVNVHNKAVEYRISKLDDLNNKLIPIYQKFPIQGIKLLDYFDFLSVLQLMNKNYHLTEEGLNQIWKIKEGMNKSRK